MPEGNAPFAVDQMKTARVAPRINNGA
jgi:hypothetical protein